MQRVILPLLAILALALAACRPASTRPDDSSAPAQTGPLAVVATTGMIADVARELAGEHAQVIALMGEGVDPHLYKPTRSDIDRVMRADLVLYNGLLLEGKMTDAFVRAATSGRRVVAVTERIDESFLLEPESFEGHFDPHVWMDPQAWSRAVEAIRDELIALDPAHASDYTSNATRYLAKLAELDAYAQRVLATVPPDRRVLVTAHDAFNYFGRRYNFVVVGIQGLSTESEAGVRDIERLVDVLAIRRIPAVFVESSVSDRNIKALIDGARAVDHTVTIGGQLFSDAMGAPGTYEGTYLGMLDHNVTTIARALGGDAPPRGMNGQLAE
jgi:manganese/zinc/iron transport system substrate-binding protein